MIRGSTDMDGKESDWETVGHEELVEYLAVLAADDCCDVAAAEEEYGHELGGG
jgi:hypothetical protein